MAPGDVRSGSPQGKRHPRLTRRDQASALAAEEFPIPIKPGTCEAADPPGRFVICAPPGACGQPRLMNVPSRNCATACCSSACVFITIGPYQATGSPIGLPETSRNLMPSSPASPSPRRRCRTEPANGCRSRSDPHLVVSRLPFRSGRRAVADAARNVPEPFEHISKSVARRSPPAASCAGPPGPMTSR